MTKSTYIGPQNINTSWDYVDFDGPCAQCDTNCEEEWFRMWDRKFGTGFVVEGLATDPAGGFNEQLIFGKKWPQYSVKANTFDSTSNKFVTIPVAARVKSGDIRVAYTDHWVTNKSYDESLRTFMKRPEEYWAAKFNPYPARGSMTDEQYGVQTDRIDKFRSDWIRCRHSHTDHVHEETLSGGSGGPSMYPIAIDDCVTGIWDYNLVDTSTTIETHDIYEAVHLYEVFPACGNLDKMSPPDEASSPLFHIFADQTHPKAHPVHDHEPCYCPSHVLDPGNWLHFMADCKEHRQPCGCGSYRGQEGKGIVFATSPWCDHTLAKESKNPHRLGMQLKNHGYKAQLFDNEGEDKIFGAVSETFLQKVGSFYKIIVRRQSYGVHQPFQAPLAAEKVMYTFLDPETPGHGPPGNSGQGTVGGFWCTRPTDDEDVPNKWATKMGATYLLTLPCKTPSSCSDLGFEEGTEDQDGYQCCEDWDYEYCEEQLEHIYFSEADILAAFDRDPRLKSSDLEKNASRERIHPDTGSKALSCQTTVVNGYVWLKSPCAEVGEKPRDFWERGLPNDPPANCAETKYTCDCEKWPGPPPATMLQANWNSPTVQTSFASHTSPPETDLIISTLWGIDGVHLGDACSWSQHSPGLFNHCNSSKKGSSSSSSGSSGSENEAAGYLMGVGFWEGRLNEEGKINFTLVKRLKLHLPKLELASGWASGGGGIMGWTDYDVRLPELANDQFDQGDHYPNQTTRFVTDFEAAEVFMKAGAGTGKYWYDLVAKKGLQLPFMGELSFEEGSADYLATHLMVDDYLDPKRPDPSPDGPSRCGNPEKVMSGSTATGTSFNPCRLNYAIDGCDNTSIKIFTGAGDPAPRFDEDQRVKTIEVDEHGQPVDDETDPEDETTTECVQYVDELFMLSEKFVDCIRDSGGEVPEIDNCEALYYGHKEYIKLKDELQETGFFTCGIPIGNVDRSLIGTAGDKDMEFCYCEVNGAITDIWPIFDWVTGQRDANYTNKVLCEMPKDPPDVNGVTGYGGNWTCSNFGAPEFELCDITWPDIGVAYGRGDSPNKYCGLVPDDGGGGYESDENFWAPASCSACEDFKCQTGLPFDASIDQPRYYVSCLDDEATHCCSFLVDNPDYDPNVNMFDFGTPLPHPKIVNSACFPNQEYCSTYGYVGGAPHIPYEHGYIWHSVLGWHPDTAHSGDRLSLEHRYSCTSGKVDFTNNTDNMAFDCCAGGKSLELKSCLICCDPPIKKVYGYPKATVEPAPTPTVYLL